MASLPPEQPQSGSPPRADPSPRADSPQAQQSQKFTPMGRWILVAGVCLILIGASIWIRSWLLNSQSPIAAVMAILFGVGGLIIAFVQTYFLFFPPKNSGVPPPLARPISPHGNSRLVKFIDFGIPVLGIIGVILPWLFRPPPLCSDNLITCSSKVVAIYVPGQSFIMVNPTHSTLQFTFNNTENGTGLALQLAPPLAVTPFHLVEIKGKSTKQFSFLLEYKVKTSGGLETVNTSDPQSFPASSDLQTVSVPIGYGGSVDQVVISFFERGQSSDVSISSISLI
jgi:hypothetical protein